MSQQSSPFISGFTPSQAASALKRALPAKAVAPLTPALGPNKKQYNPFLLAMNSDSQEFREMYGVNRPLSKPMFLGYRDNQPMYGGSRLFLLY